MEPYYNLVRELLAKGVPRDDRTGTGTVSLFGRQLRFDVREGYPLLTARKLHFKSVAEELLWFVAGKTNSRELEEKGVTIWQEWSREDGDLGPVYGAQFRRWPLGTCCSDVSMSLKNGIQIKTRYFDQLAWVIEEIKRNPDSRRLIVSAWNVAQLSEMALPPCHLLFQFYVDQGHLDCQVYQRSADVFLGLPFNIASYALLLEMLAQVTGLKAREVIFSLGDAHLYTNHEEQARELLRREPRPLPTLVLEDRDDLFEFQYADITLKDYHPHPAIHAEVAV